MKWALYLAIAASGLYIWKGRGSKSSDAAPHFGAFVFFMGLGLLAYELFMGAE